ncbi:phage tail tape measure protein, partial [Brevibacillus laterosporus]|nr:phage tail tape measure protein [Brevibacillus laterosporus]
LKQFLGFSSPTEKGPASKSDRWAPNLMRMFSEGITDSLPYLQSATGTVAEALRSKLNGSIEVAPKLHSKLSLDESLSGVTPARRVSQPQNTEYNSQLPDIHFHIHQQPGEDSEALIRRIKREALQYVLSELARTAQRANMTMGRGAFGGAK